jgi:hypothetical protein
MARAQNARITVTLSGVATTEELAEMENRIMSALSDAVATMRTAVEGVAGRLGDPGALEAAVAAERARFDELVTTEAAEDVAQDAELQAARAEVDRLVAEQTAAAGELVTLADQLNTVGTAVEEAEPGTPVEDVPVPDVVVPDPVAPEDPADVGPGVPDDATPGPAPDEDADVPPAPAPAPDDAAPAPAPAPAPDGGPTDADGNPVAPPTI